MFSRISFMALFAAFLAAPALASAHERQLFNIGGTDYLFVVGSLGEPVVVDDKTGVELRVQIADPKDPTNSSAVGVKPAEGLESTLKVEISAGDKKKNFDLTTVYGTPGSYKAVFFPTIQTALTYRFFGTVNNTNVDLSFTCNPAGHVAAPEDKTEVAMGEGVIRKFKAGQFGCPLAKGELGFPEASMTVVELHEDAEHHMAEMAADMEKDAAEDKTGAALAFGILGVILGIIALWRSRAPKL